MKGMTLMVIGFAIIIISSCMMVVCLRIRTEILAIKVKKAKLKKYMEERNANNV